MNCALKELISIFSQNVEHNPRRWNWAFSQFPFHFDRFGRSVYLWETIRPESTCQIIQLRATTSAGDDLRRGQQIGNVKETQREMSLSAGALSDLMFLVPPARFSPPFHTYPVSHRPHPTSVCVSVFFDSSLKQKKNAAPGQGRAAAKQLFSCEQSTLFQQFPEWCPTFLFTNERWDTCLLLPDNGHDELPGGHVFSQLFPAHKLKHFNLNDSPPEENIDCRGWWKTRNSNIKTLGRPVEVSLFLFPTNGVRWTVTWHWNARVSPISFFFFFYWK